MNKQYKESGGLWLAILGLIVIGYALFSGDTSHETQNLIVVFGLCIMFKLERISNGLSNYFKDKSEDEPPKVEKHRDLTYK